MDVRGSGCGRGPRAPSGLPGAPSGVPLGAPLFFLGGGAASLEGGAWRERSERRDGRARDERSESRDGSDFCFYIIIRSLETSVASLGIW